MSWHMSLQMPPNIGAESSKCKHILQGCKRTSKRQHGADAPIGTKEEEEVEAHTSVRREEGAVALLQKCDYLCERRRRKAQRRRECRACRAMTRSGN
eukprot:1645032-Pleurochrysis_carterae.AAC.2